MKRASGCPCKQDRGVGLPWPGVGPTAAWARIKLDDLKILAAQLFERRSILLPLFFCSRCQLLQRTSLVPERQHYKHHTQERHRQNARGIKQRIFQSRPPSGLGFANTLRSERTTWARNAPASMLGRFGRRPPGIFHISVQPIVHLPEHVQHRLAPLIAM